MLLDGAEVAAGCPGLLIWEANQPCRAAEPAGRAGDASAWLPSAGCAWLTPLLLPSPFEMGMRKLGVCPKGTLLLALMETGPLWIPAHRLEAGIFVPPCQERSQGLDFPLMWGWSRALEDSQLS